MSDISIWIQIENHAWDLAPNNINRMTGQQIRDIKGEHPPQTVTLSSPETSVITHPTMFKPIQDALILRRYTENWATPADQKVNPWDLNEPDPTDSGTMGTIPGPVIECNVGDRVIVHFRNKDNRNGLDVIQRMHSLHTHGFVFNITHDGAYPLSPPDPNQPVENERELWNSIGSTSDFKVGDRVPPGGTFTYIWNTFSWPTTAGVWLYHDHSINDMENVQNGAIGIVVIHNSADTQNEVFNPGLPGGSKTGKPVDNTDHFIQPPENTLYLLLFHVMKDGSMCMNGRRWLGNTPTLISGVNTKMRFGVVTMGDIHTFHLHGHRWIIPGPDGIHPSDIQNSIQNKSTSQFEDTRIMGSANSFNFTIQQGSFMGSVFTPDSTQAPGLGEWHLHCHVPEHMMEGMMGSLYVAKEGDKPILQSGVALPDQSGNPTNFTITVDHNKFVSPDGTNVLTVPSSGTTVIFGFEQPNHTVVIDNVQNADPIDPINNGNGDTDGVGPVPKQITRVITGNMGGEIRYHCGIHGQVMNGIIRIGMQM